MLPFIVKRAKRMLSFITIRTPRPITLRSVATKIAARRFLRLSTPRASFESIEPMNIIVRSYYLNNRLKV
jgi:hypothetical protein